MSLLRVLVFRSACALCGLAPLGLKAAEPGAAGAVIYPRAAEAAPATAPAAASGYRSVLLGAIVLAGAGGWLFWRARGTPGRGAALRQLSIAETKSLGNRQFLVVACYEDKKFLLGVCPGRIDLLTPLENGPRAGAPP